MVNKRVWNAVLGCNLKNDRVVSVHLQGKPFISQLSKSMSQPVTLKKLKLNGFMKTYNPFRTNTPKRCRFHYRGLECKSRKSRNTWSNRQIWPWSTEWSKARANRVLPRESTGHSKHPLPTTQEKTLHMDITRWSTPKSSWLYSLQPKLEKLYTVSTNKTRTWLWLRSWIPFARSQREESCPWQRSWGGRLDITQRRDQA